MGFFQIRISSPRKEFKLHFVHTGEKTDQRKVCKYPNFKLCINVDVDTSVLSLLTLVIFETKSQFVFAGYL